MTRPARVPSSAARYVLSRFVSVSWRGGAGLVFSPLTRAEIGFSDRRFLPLLQRFAAPTRLEQAARDPDERELAEALVGAKVIVPVDDDGVADEPYPLSLWAPHDLQFHVRARLGKGKTYRFLGQLERAPALKPAGGGEMIPLSPPPAPEEPFWRVLRGRRSCRRFSTSPLPFEGLASLLHHAARNVATVRDPLEADACYRPYAAAAHSVEIYAVVPPRACSGLRAGTYHYRPGDDALERISGPGEASRQIARTARACTGLRGRGWVVLCMTTRFPRIAWKYEGIAYSLALKELGSLYQALYLTGSALGLGVCAMGTGPFDALPALSGVPWTEEAPIGEMVVGLPEEA